MILLKLISWPYIRKHLLRWMLTIAGIVLGVAVFVGMHTANQSVLFAFRHTVDQIAGATQLQISAGETGFDENVLDRVQAVEEGVRCRRGSGDRRAAMTTGLKGQGNVLILGVDMTGDRGLRDYDLKGGEDAGIDDPLIFLAQPDSLDCESDTFARENNLGIGSKVPMSTMQGEKLFTVRGIAKSGVAHQRLRRQSRGDGCLRRAEGVRLRTQVRSHRLGSEGRRKGWMRHRAGFKPRWARAFR